MLLSPRFPCCLPFKLYIYLSSAVRQPRNAAFSSSFFFSLLFGKVWCWTYLGSSAASTKATVLTLHSISECCLLKCGAWCWTALAKSRNIKMWLASHAHLNFGCKKQRPTWSTRFWQIQLFHFSYIIFNRESHHLRPYKSTRLKIRYKNKYQIINY